MKSIIHPTNSALASSSSPSQTLYVQNLDDKIKKSDLKRLLYQFFSIHAKVIDVVVKKGKMRGQAFVVFSDFQGATQAMRQLDGTGFLERDLKITYAKGKSHATIKQIAGDEVLYHVKLGLKDPNTLQDITSKNSGKLRVSGAQAAQMEKKKAEELETKKRLQGSLSDDEEEQDEEAEDEQEETEGKTTEELNKNSTITKKKKKIKTSHGDNQVEGDGPEDDRDGDDDEEAMEEDSDSEQPVDSAAAAAVKAAGSAPILSGQDPNPVLFLEGLPAEVTDDMMAVLFQQYSGFQSVRLVPGRTGIAFVQYDTATQSDMAKAALDGFQLAPGVIMKVSFAHRG